MIRVALCDDHPVFLEGLARIINLQSDMKVVGAVGSGVALLELAATTTFDVAIVDVTMPGLAGFELVRRLSSDFSSTKVIVFSASPEEQYGVRFLRGGAHAYLSKLRPTTELLTAIEKVVSGVPYLTDSLSQRLIQQRAGDYLECLSNRELEVVRYLVDGKSSSDIADDLSISRSTVSTHLASIRQKLAVETNHQVVRLVTEQQRQK